MKKKITTLLILFASISTLAQQGINYKAIIKDGTGNVLASTSITVQLSILKGIAQTNVYQETHTSTTNINGLVILNIGNGSIDSGIFTNIDWASEEHFLNVQIDSGTGLVDMGTTQFLAVPYALSVLGFNSVRFATDTDDLTYRSNTFVGAEAGCISPLGTDNIAIGTRAFNNNCDYSVYNCIAIGHESLQNYQLQDALAIGYRSQQLTTTGHRNLSIGNSSLLYNIDGGFNTAIGFHSLWKNVSGNKNTAIGYNSLASSLGDNNTAIGYRAGDGINGSNNIIIGKDTFITNSSNANRIISIGNLNKPLTSSDTNSIIIGNNLYGKGSNTAVWGDNNISEHYFSDKMILNSDGTATLPLADTSTITENKDVLTKEFGDTNYQLKLQNYTVATLPAGTLGDTAYVTDAIAPTYLGLLTGGGSVVCPVFYNGSNWVSH